MPIPRCRYVPASFLNCLPQTLHLTLQVRTCHFDGIVLLYRLLPLPHVAGQTRRILCLCCLPCQVYGVNPPLQVRKHRLGSGWYSIRCERRGNDRLPSEPHLFTTPSASCVCLRQCGPPNLCISSKLSTLGRGERMAKQGNEATSTEEVARTVCGGALAVSAHPAQL